MGKLKLMTIIGTTAGDHPAVRNDKVLRPVL